MAAAEADLQSRFVSLGTEMAEELSAEDPDAKTKVEQVVAALVEKWAARYDSEVELFLGEADAQVDRRLDRPAAQHTATFLKSLAENAIGEPSQDVNSRVVRLLNDMHGDVEGVVRESFELKMGRSIEKLLQDIESLKHPKSGGTGRAGPGTAATDPGPGKIDAAIAAQIANAGLEIASGVLAIVTTIDAEVRQQRLDEAVRKERESARDALEEAATTFAANLVHGSDSDPGWSARVAAGLELIRQSVGVPEDPVAIDATAGEVQRLAGDLDEFRRLLDECPA